MESRTPSAGAPGIYDALLSKLAGEAALTPREEAALDFAERLATRHHTIHEGFIDEMRRHFSDPELVELGLMTGAFIMFGRLQRAFDVPPIKPGADLAAASEERARRSDT